MAKTLQKLTEHWKQTRLMIQKGQLGTRKRRTDMLWNDAADHSPLLAVFLGLLLWLVCVVVLTLPGRFDLPYLTLDQPAMNTVYAAVNFSYEDTEATRKEQDRAVHNGPLHYRIDPVRSQAILDNLHHFSQAVSKRAEAAVASKPLPPGDANPIAQKVMALTPAVFQRLIPIEQNLDFRAALDQELRERIEKGIRANDDAPGEADTRLCSIADRQSRVLTRKFKLSELPTVRKVAESLVKTLDSYQPDQTYPEPVHAALLELMEALFGNQGNLIRDAERTIAADLATRAAVKPVIVDVHQNDLLIRRGEIATLRHLEALKAHNQMLQQFRSDASFWRELVRNVLWSLIMIFFVAFYLYHIHPGILRSTRQIGLLCTVTALALVTNFLSLRFFHTLSLYFSFPPDLLSYTIPLALPTVLLAVMIGFRVSIYIGFFVALIAAMMLRSNFAIALEGMVLGAVVSLAVRSVSNYRSFFVRSFIAVAPTVWLLNFSLMNPLHHMPAHLLNSGLLALGNALFTAVAGLILVFLFEILFNVSTNMSLMAMCDSSHPLLKELHLKAPGTSQHCQNVAILAENAATAIHANPVRARACALFHDIGKLQKPEFFTENNLNGINMHATLTPRMSSMIIISHVKDGLDLALQHKLCKVLRDAIQQHHGTDLMHFFYQRALQGADPVLESDFRYPGPLPQAKEIVIVSLADACEAACRSLEKPTASKIEGMVVEIFRKRWRDGQLADAALTIAELSEIQESFILTLTSMYHSRIAYPKEMDDEDDLFMEQPAAPGAAANSAKKSDA